MTVRLKKQRRARPWRLTRYVAYRPTMRLFHRFGRHWWTTLGPIPPENTRWRKCEWCGATTTPKGSQPL